MPKTPLARILIIDDTESNRHTVARYLRQAGYEVWEAGTGEEGLRLAQNGPDLVVLDVKLPDMLGFEVCRQLKSDPTTARIPVMHISATFTLTSVRVEGVESGADTYMAGPIEGQELIANVRALLRMQEAEKMAQKTTERCRFVLSSITEAYYSLDKDNRFVELNRAAEKKLFGGRSEQELRGKVIWEEFPQGLKSEFASRYQEARAKNQPVHFEAQSAISGGWFETHVYPRDDVLEIYLRDITERKKAEQAVRHSQEELLKLNRELEVRVAERTARLRETVGELEAFSYTISHDMRAPLRAMQGFAQMLEEDCGNEISPTARDYVKRILVSASRLDQMIQDVLALSRVSRADTKLDDIPVDRLIADIIKHDPNLQPEKADIVVEKNLPRIQANLALFRQILCNLLDNAVKFVAPGTRPQVRVYGVIQDAMVRLYIEDNGIGIAPQHQERIFKIFERLHAGHYTGTGLGLSIVRKAAERMGGRAGVESALGKGSKFWVELPAGKRKG